MERPGALFRARRRYARATTTATNQLRMIPGQDSPTQLHDLSEVAFRIDQAILAVVDGCDVVQGDPRRRIVGSDTLSAPP